MVSSKGIRIEDKRIEAVKQWSNPRSVQDIQVFLGFANFYMRFIQGFSRIAAPLTSMLKTSSNKSAEPRKGIIGVGSNSRARCEEGELDRSGMDNIEVDSGEVGDNEIGKKGRNLSTLKKTESSFLTYKARIAFTKLKQAFIKALILHYFDPERHIRVEMDKLSYAIDGVLSQLWTI